MEWFSRACTGSCEFSPVAGSVCEELIVPNISLLKFYPHVMQFLCSFVLVYFVLTEGSRTLNRCQCSSHILCHEHSMCVYVYVCVFMYMCVCTSHSLCHEHSMCLCVCVFMYVCVCTNHILCHEHSVPGSIRWEADCVGRSRKQHTSYVYDKCIFRGARER